MSMWSVENTTTLIQLYEQHECLYVVTNPHYKNKVKRRSALSQIVTELNENNDMNVDLDIVLKKINGLRSTFIMESNKVKKSEHSGAGRDSLYTPSWWCFDLLGFLNVGRNVEETSSNLSIISRVEDDDTENKDDETEVYEGTIEGFNQNGFDFDRLANNSSGPSTAGNSRSNTPAGPAIQRNKRNATKAIEDIHSQFLTESAQVLERVASRLDNPPKKQKLDHISNFCQSMETELRLIKDELSLTKLKRQIINLVYDALEK